MPGYQCICTNWWTYCKIERKEWIYGWLCIEHLVCLFEQFIWIIRLGMSVKRYSTHFKSNVHYCFYHRETERSCTQICKKTTSTWSGKRIAIRMWYSNVERIYTRHTESSLYHLIQCMLCYNMHCNSCMYTQFNFQFIDFYSSSKERLQYKTFSEIYRQHRNKYINELHNAEEAYYSSMADKLSSSDTPPKTWWKTVKHFLGKNKEPDLPPIKDGTPIHYSNDEKAEAFNNFFLNNAFLNCNNATLPRSVPLRTERITNIVATEQDVLDIIKSINVNKATGPDGVSPTMLREAGLSIVKPLTKLINLSLRTAIFPDSWKLAHVLPLHKKNDKSEINNYRPISLLSCVSKIAECVVFKYTFNYVHENHLLSPFQSSFIPGDSTVNQLVNVYHMLCEALDKKKEVRVVFCDISKAFDRVWHEGLLYKLERMGISGALLLWFKGYISNRKQKVIIENSSSKTGDIQAGVPQGSVLGPLLFLIYINDITDNVNSHIRLFADETTLFIDFSDDISATQQINNDLATIRDWADRWLVSFCPKKLRLCLFLLNIEQTHHLPYISDRQE